MTILDVVLSGIDRRSRLRCGRTLAVQIANRWRTDNARISNNETVATWHGSSFHCEDELLTALLAASGAALEHVANLLGNLSALGRLLNVGFGRAACSRDEKNAVRYHVFEPV